MQSDHLDDVMNILYDPSNNEHQTRKDTKEERQEVRGLYLTRNTAWPSKAFEFVIYLEGQLVGFTNIYLSNAETKTAVVGLVIHHTHWRRGLGLHATMVTTQIAFDIGMDNVEIGTMKSNSGMRKILSKMGEEKEHIVQVPNIGVVAEVCLFIHRSDWTSSMELRTDQTIEPSRAQTQ